MLMPWPAILNLVFDLARVIGIQPSETLAMSRDMLFELHDKARKWADKQDG